MKQEIKQAERVSEKREDDDDEGAKTNEQRANIKREKVIVDLLACGLLWPLLDYPKYTRLLRNGRGRSFLQEVDPLIYYYLERGR